MVRLAPIGTESAVRLEFEISTRGTLGLRSELLTETRGTAVLFHSYLDYRPFQQDLRLGRRRGVLVSKETYDALAQAFEFLPVSGLELKGFEGTGCCQ